MKTKVVGVLFCVWFVATGWLKASVVSPNSVSLLSGTTSAASPYLAGTVVNDQLIPFSIQDSLGNTLVEGKLQERVTRSTATGQLVYAPRIRNLSAPNGEAWVMGLSYTGFDGTMTNVDYRIDGLGQVGPNSVSRSADGDRLHFRHDPNLIVPPDEQKFLSIYTDSEYFAPAGEITIYAQNDFGANVFSTTLHRVAAPAFAGDANLDGLFDSADLVQVFAAGEFEDGILKNSTWHEGDWNDDLEFDTADLVAAFRAGNYSDGAAAVSAVPEPSAANLLWACGLVAIMMLRRPAK
ncbi:MAG: hypothetical protein R3C28_24980 [Pirellulaceae bacterium]